MKIMLFSIFLGLCYLVAGMYYSITCNIPILGVFILMTSPFIMVFLNIKLDDLVDYIGIMKRRFKLEIRHVIDHDVVHYNSVRSLVCKGYGDVNFYEYRCRGISIFLDKDVANKYFLDPLDPTINELTMFELCGYNDCKVTLEHNHDYSKSFDELFGYYMQQGFVNKIKYVIKNRDRF